MGYKIPEYGIASGFRNGAEVDAPKSQAPARTQDANTKLKLTKRGEKLLKGGAAVALGALAFSALVERGGHQYSTVSEKDKVAALKQTDHVQNGDVTIMPGAKLRLTPAFEDGTPEDGDPNNLAMVVEKGHIVNVTSPLTSAEHPGWVAFTLVKGAEKENVPTSDRNRAEQTVWANVTDLEDQHLAKETFSAGQPFSELPATVTSNGSISVTDPNALIANNDIATGHYVENGGGQG
jgi:hypothetical protein